MHQAGPVDDRPSLLHALSQSRRPLIRWGQPARALEETLAEETTVVASSDAPPAAQTAAGTRPSYVDRNLTSGSTPKNLWFLAWPQIVESVLNIADQLADIFWAGRLGTQSVAGLGVSQSYVTTASTARMGLDTAMRALVARAVGAGDLQRANHVALQAFTLSGAFALIMAFVGVFLTEPLMRMLGISQGVIDAGADYMRIQFVGAGALAFRTMAGAALQASGDSMTPMRATTVTRLFNIALSPFLIFGWLLFPELGLKGAAIAGVISQSSGGVINFRALFRGTSRLKLTLRRYRPDPALLWRLVKTGAPASITSAERSLSNLILVGLIAPFGDTVLAAFALTRRIELLATMGGTGIGNASGVLVAQNLGAGQPERARESIRWAVLFVLAFNLVLVAVMLIFPRPILSIFDNDKELLDVAVDWLRIQALGYFVLGLGIVFSQSYNTAGDTLVPMLAVAVYWLVQQPAALILPDLGFGSIGIAWAILLGLVVRLFIYVPYYFTDRWMKVRL
ncbi:MAG: MATE family efflux transporter [Dehalococcoidia bacterium]